MKIFRLLSLLLAFSVGTGASGLRKLPQEVLEDGMVNVDFSGHGGIQGVLGTLPLGLTEETNNNNNNNNNNETVYPFSTTCTTHWYDAWTVRRLRLQQGRCVGGIKLHQCKKGRCPRQEATDEDVDGSTGSDYDGSVSESS